MPLSETGHVNIPSGKAGLADIPIYFEKYVSSLANAPEKPTLLFLHGGAGIADHNIYVPFWSQLTDVANIEFIDLRGHGQSGGHESSYQETWHLSQWADDIIAYCDVRGIEDPIIAGVSFGTWVAYAYLTQYPQHAKKVIFVNGEPWVNTELCAEKFKARAIERAATEELSDRIAYGEKIKQIVLNLREIALNKQSSTANTAQIYTEHCVPLIANASYTKEELAKCTKKNILLWNYFNNHEYYKFDYRNQLNQLKLKLDKFKQTKQDIPVIFMIAGEYDPAHPFEGSEDAAKRLAPYAQCIVIPNTGDPVYRDRPDESLQVLRNCILHSGA